MTIGSLFTGIGGLELGFHWEGYETKWMCEIDDFAQEILQQRFPSVPIHEDVHEIDSQKVSDVEVLTGGFPCQPTSQAAGRSERGKGWLWPEFNRLIEDLKPKYAVIENPESLRYRNRGLGTVLRDLAESGYNAEWRVLPASLFGAPHRRARIWVVAHTHSYGQPNLSVDDETPILQKPSGIDRRWSNPPTDMEMDDGVSGGMERDRLRAFGNAVVPQVAQYVAKCIKQHERKFRKNQRSGMPETT